ncbi:tyrosine-type recombinase/integrase [Burkholderiaceae bacterium DAT-1]|nr:tyrosine-type recombinase/integrase [Burkholderiaceae bacterium DAT-1]
MSIQSQATASHNMPIQTSFKFSKAALEDVACNLRANQVKQLECNDTQSKGLRAVVYPSGKVVFYARIAHRGSSKKERLGELEFVSVSTARERNQAVRASVAAGKTKFMSRGEGLTLSDFFTHHYVPSASLRKRTLHTDQSRFANWIAPALGKSFINRIRVIDVERMLSTMAITPSKETGKVPAPATLNHILELTKAIFNHAVSLEFIETSPAAKVRRTKVENRPDDFMSQDDMRAFLDAAMRDEAVTAASMLMLMLLTGARLGEARHLKWDDLNLDANEWRITKQKSGKKGKIYLPDVAATILTAMRSRSTNAYVFSGTSEDGCIARPIRVFDRICKEAGLVKSGKRRFRIHDLRHAFCSSLAGNGTPFHLVSAAARHSSMAMTKRYVHEHANDLIYAVNEHSMNVSPEKKYA